MNSSVNNPNGTNIFEQFITARDKAISAHQILRASEPYAAQIKRLERLTEGLILGMQSIRVMSLRNPELADNFLTFQFFSDPIQSIISIWSLAKEGQLTPAKREMRYMLESCSKHVYIDLKLTGTPIYAKQQFLKNEISRSSVSFTSDFRLYHFSEMENKAFMDCIRSSYASLCKYVHRSPEQIEEALDLLQRGIFPGFETQREMELFVRKLAQLYDLILVMYFNAIGMSSTGDIFVYVLDKKDRWPYHKTKYVKLLSSYFNYKHERKGR